MRAKNARVYRVHRRELSHIDQEDAASKDVLKIRTRRFQDRLDVSEAGLGLRLDALRHHARNGIGGTLA